LPDFYDKFQKVAKNIEGFFIKKNSAFTLKPILRPKKNYGNSKNISLHKNIIFKKILPKKKKTKILQDIIIITLL
jgi:hypothetical protein